MDRLVAILDLEEIELNVFRGVSPTEPQMRVFGGQVAAQALVASIRTVPDKVVHSLHAYFLRPGDPQRPIVYEVDRIRDGRSYATRRVVGIQHGKAIFNLQASFHGQGEEGYEHQLPMPTDVEEPDLATLSEACDAEQLENFLWKVRPIVVRVAAPSSPYRRLVWFRANGTLPDDVTLHQCVAAYASDLTLLGTTLLAHGYPDVRPGFMASLDHAMWFHRPFRADEWLLYEQTSPSATHGRGLAMGQIYTADGRLAMTVVQEGVIRPPHP
ncbi:MAG: acyl-CoA thioesterase II [Actinomycetota bacterium]|nr:acyl-CoA thioesterase II [Actinomycetota bacterium]